MKLGNSLVLLAGLLFSTHMAFAQDEPGKKGNSGNDRAKLRVVIDTRIYPVQQLITPIVYQESGHSESSVKKPACPTRTSCTNELIARIQKEVAPASWAQAGGDGSIHVFSDGGTLVVNQTPKVHAELKAFLKTIERRGQICLDMRIAIVSPQVAENIRWTTKDKLTFASFGSESPATFLLQSAETLHSPRTISLNGSVASFEACSTKHFVTGVATEEVAGKKCLILCNEEFKTGIWAKVLAYISEDRTRVKLSLDFNARNLRCTQKSVMRVPVPADDQEVNDDDDPAEEKAVDVEIQKPLFDDIKVALTATVGDGRTLAIRAGQFVRRRTIQEPSAWSEIPILGQFFDPDTTTLREPVEVILLLTPRILVMEDEDVDVGPLQGPIRPVNDGKFPLFVDPEGRVRHGL